MAICVLPALLVVGCASESSSDGPPAGPWREEYAASAAAATSDFEKAVFEDWSISAAEYRESLDRYVACLDGKGVSMTLQEDDGIFGFAVLGDLDEAFDTASEACRVGNNLLVEPLYVDSYLNPERRDRNELIAECMVREGVVEAPFSAADVEAGLAAADTKDSTWSSTDPTAIRCINRPVR